MTIDTIHCKHMRKTARSPKRALCLLLAALTLCACLPAWGLGAKAAGTPTNLGLAEHGIMAYNEGWQYSYGGKGETVGGVRVSDCAGLIYSYFSDLGVGGCMGGATSQATQNCILTGLFEEGLPRIHGLALTILEPGATDDYSHIGIYIGGEESCENSDYGTNMVRASIYRRGWTTWHLFDNGVRYPREGWYEFDGGMVHYTNYEYDVNTTIDGYTIGADGFAQLSDGERAPVDSSMVSTDFVSAEEVRSWLVTNGWSGSNDFDYNAKVSSTSVNLRAEPNTSSTIVATLSKGTRLHIDGPAVEGEAVAVGTWIGDQDHVGDEDYGYENAQLFSKWYPVTTIHGQSGYVSEAYIELVISAPTITCDGESVTIDAGGYSDSIYYTTDGSEPTEESELYLSPVYQLSCTYQAAVIRNGVVGPVTTVTVMGNGAIFTDFTYKNWFAPHVDKAVGLGLFSGTSANTFSPNTTLTRAQLVKILANMSGEDTSSYEFGDSIPAFSDVQENAYYYHDLAWAVQAGIVSKGKKFNPSASVPREQLCLMLSNMAKRYDAALDGSQDKLFSDDDKISSWAKTAVYEMRNLGVVSGTGNNAFEPKGTSTRATAATMLVSFYNKVVALHDTSGDNLPATKA